MNLVNYRNKIPSIHNDCLVAPSATIVGDVSIGAGTVVLHGAVIVAESAPVKIGKNCVIMENAVIRGAGKNPTLMSDYILVGPHTHITGAKIGRNCMIATNACVFNGAELGKGTLVAIGAIVHIATSLKSNSKVPMYHIAMGNPAEIFPPGHSPRAHEMIAEVGFTKTVFDFDTSEMTFEESMRWLCDTYAHCLRKHPFNIV